MGNGLTYVVILGCLIGLVAWASHARYAAVPPPSGSFGVMG